MPSILCLRVCPRESQSTHAWVIYKDVHCSNFYNWEKLKIVKISTDRGMNNNWQIHVIENYIGVKKNKWEFYMYTWIVPKNLFLSEKIKVEWDTILLV